MVRHLDVRLRQVERRRGLLHRVIEDVTQQQHGTLFWREVLERWTALHASPDILIGDGVLTYASVVSALKDLPELLPPPMLAGTVGLMAAQAGERSGLNPAAIRPLYVRRPDAEIAREAAQLKP